MKRLLLFVIGCIMVLVAAMPAMAFNSDEIVKVLKTAKVYVAPNIPGTDSDTPGRLGRLLDDKDNIVVVMLPATVLGGTETVAGLAKGLDKALGGKVIIGLAVGDSVVGYSTLLPSGVAPDMMNRAQDVATNTVEALGTFVTNIHAWQTQHPKQPASKPAAKVKKKNEGGFPWLGVIIGLCIGSGILYMMGRRLRPLDEYGNKRLKQTPNPVKEPLEQLRDLQPQVENPDLRGLLTQIRGDVEEFFKRARRDGVDFSDEEDAFMRHLRSVCDVLANYIEIQSSPDRYYGYKKTELMRNREQAVQGFAALVENAIQRTNKRALIDYDVKSDILRAETFR